MSERWKIPTHHHTVPDSAERKKKPPGVEKSRIPDLVDCSLQQQQKQASDQASLALDCYNTPGMLSWIHHGQKKRRRKKEMTMAHNSFRRSVVTIREVYLLYPISVYATTC